MKAICVIAVAAVSATLISACVQIKTAQANESTNTAVEIRNVAPFAGVEFGLPATLHVSQNNLQSVQVEAASDIISSIRTNVMNGILTIDAKQPLVTTEPITIHRRLTPLRKSEIVAPDRW